MNAADREALERLTKSIEGLSDEVRSLDYLSDEKTVEALKNLVAIAPTLKKLSDAYEAASWFTSAVKLLGALVAAVLAVITFWNLNFGDKP